MRKHDVRKWLHACLDLLPVFLIPVFMIYSHRHDITERTNVEITYKYETNEVNTIDDINDVSIYEFPSVNLHSEDYIFTLGVLSYSNVTNLSTNDYELSDWVAESYQNDDCLLIIDYDNGITHFSYTDANGNVTIFRPTTGYNVVFTDLVFMVNAGLEDFKALCELYEILPQATDYNIIERVNVEDSNSDIMSVFMDDFNHAIDKYFNMGNVFNMNGVYDWFNINIFNGHAPLIIQSIWNIALYEFVMDLLFLLYGLFMWFIDMVQHLMDKPFKSIK